MASRSRKPQIDINGELRHVFHSGISSGGEALEAIAVLLADPGADHTPGGLARLGAAFSAIGSQLSDAAREQAAANGIAEDLDVFFTARGPTAQTRVNTQYLRERFPAVNYPEMWQTVQVKGSVSIDLPFKT